MASDAAAAASSSGGLSLGPPPEGVDWNNRWSELENAFVAVEAEKKRLKLEVDTLRKEQVEKALNVLAPQAPAIDRQEIEKLEARHSAALQQAEARLKEIVEERNRAGKLCEDLESKTASLANLSKEKLQLQYELNIAKSSLLPVEKERDRFREAAEEAEKRCEELRQEMLKASEAKNKMFKEKQELKRELMAQVDEAQATAKFQESIAEEAREQQQVAMKRTSDAERKIREQAESFAEERASLERKLTLRGEQLDRANDLRDAGVAQLQETKETLEAARASEKDALAAAEEQKARVSALEEELGQLRREHEELLRRRVPGAAALTSPPEGFASVSDLVQQVTVAKADALHAKQEKEQYQDVLLEVEREIRARYPALENQRREYERLCKVSAQLTRQNEELLKQVQSADRGQRDAEAQTKQAKRSAQILEEHARDMANQLGVLVVKNQKLSGKTPSRPPGITDLEALESDRKYFHNVQDLALQNEHLKKAVRRLSEECETEAQRELTAERQAHEDQAKAWEEHLAAKAEQMKALAANIERLTHERDSAQRALSNQPPQPVVATAPPAAATPPVAASGSSGGKATGPMATRGDLVPREHLTVVREEFSKSMEVLRNEARELRASELRTREELAKAQAKLDCELNNARTYESSRKQLEKRLEERKVRCAELEKRSSDFEKNLERETEAARTAEAALGQAKRDIGHLESQLKLERSAVARLEHGNATLVVEKATHTQHNVDLQTRMTQQAEAYNGMKADLEAAYKKAEDHLKEQLEHAKRREQDLETTVKDVTTARTEREAETDAVRKRAAELETNLTRLETQLAERTFELDELRASLPSRPRRGSEVAAEAEEQLRKAQTPQPKAEDVAKLEQKVRFAEEREKKHAEDKKLWESLIAQHEKDLKSGSEREAQLDNELKELREQQAKHNEITEKAKQTEEKLEAQVFESDKKAKDLQAKVEQKEAEVAAAKLDAEQKVQEAQTQLQTIEHQTADARENLEDWQRKHREAVQAHAKDISELDTVKGKSKMLETEVKELRQKTSDLEVDKQQARKQRTDEVESLKKRLADAEKHAEALADESKRYQEKLLAFAEQSAGGPNVDMERIAQEMRRAREIGEFQKQELELDKERSAREVKKLQEEVSELHSRLDKEQATTLDLQAEVKRQQRGLGKLERLGLLEDENRRLAEEAKSAQQRLDEATKELESQKQQLEPLQLCKREMSRREEDWENVKKEMEAKADEWKDLYNEMVQKFDSLDVKELKKLREDQINWNAAKTDLTKRVEKLSEDLKQALATKGNVEELQKSLTEAQASVKKLTEAQAQLTEDNQRKSADATRLDGLVKLYKNKMDGLANEIKSKESEGVKLKDEAAKIQQDKTNLAARVEKLSQDLKKGGEEASQAQALKQRNEELQKKLADEQELAKKERVLKAQVQEAKSKLETQVKNAESIKALHTKKIEELEKKMQEKEAELVRSREEAAKAANADTAAALKKVEDELGATRQRADKAMSLAMDYQRGCDALIGQNNSTLSKNRQLEERLARERAPTQQETVTPVTAAPSAPSTSTDSSQAGTTAKVQTIPVATSSAPSAPPAIDATAAKGAEDVSMGITTTESGGSSGSTVGAALTSNPFAAGGANTVAIFGTATTKRKLESSDPSPGEGVGTEAAPAKTAKTAPTADTGVDTKGSPPATPAPKKAPAALVAANKSGTSDSGAASAVPTASAPSATPAASPAIAPAAAPGPVVDLENETAQPSSKDQSS